jgi:hypothetical protein
VLGKFLNFKKPMIRLCLIAPLESEVLLERVFGEFMK